MNVTVTDKHTFPIGYCRHKVVGQLRVASPQDTRIVQITTNIGELEYEEYHTLCVWLSSEQRLEALLGDR